MSAYLSWSSSIQSSSHQVCNYTATFQDTFATNNIVRCAESMTMKLRSKMFQATLKQDIAFFDETKNSTGSLTSAISQKPQQVNSAAGMTTAAVVQSIITLVVGLLIAFVVSIRKLRACILLDSQPLFTSTRGRWH